MNLRRALMPMVGLLALVATACPETPGGGGGGTTAPPTTADSGPPVAVAGAGPSTIGDAPLVVTFDSSGSTPGTGTGLTYAWDFGDGSPIDSSVAPTHIYNTPSASPYLAKLTLTNSAGTSTSPNIPIQVNTDPNPSTTCAQPARRVPAAAHCSPRARQSPRRLPTRTTTGSI